MKHAGIFTPEPGLFPKKENPITRERSYSIAPSPNLHTAFPVVVRSSVFPNLNRLKSLIKKAKENNRDWPHVLLNVSTRNAFRPEVEGPLSIFMNIKGKSRCRANNYLAEIGDNQFFVTNAGQSYSFEIESEQPVEIFNLHIGEQFVSEVFSGIEFTNNQLLDDPFGKKDMQVEFFNRLQFKDEEFSKIIQNIYYFHKEADALWIEEQLAILVEYLIRNHHSHLAEKARLPLVNAHSRQEVFRRLTLAINYIHAHFRENPDLSKLSNIACLSRFHFLRLFKQSFGKTPHQYLISLKLEKAKILLSTTLSTTTEIAFSLGFQNVSSFCRIFQRKIGCSPLQYRIEVGSKVG